MRITDRLRAQNEVVLQQLRRLEQLIDDGAGSEILAAVVATIAAAEDEHALNEEPIVMSALGRVLGPGYPVLRELAREHRQLRGLETRIADGSCDAAQARVFALTLRGHLQREAEDLLPLVDRWVAEATLSLLADECATAEAVR